MGRIVGGLQRAARLDVAARPWAFWFGITAVTSGVILHLPMWLDAADMHYQLAGMPVDTPMLIGMPLILIGLVVGPTAEGLITAIYARKYTERHDVADEQPIGCPPD